MPRGGVCAIDPVLLKLASVPKNAVTSPNASTQKVVYLYRDAANFKCRGEFCVAGTIVLEDLRPFLLDSEFFVPEAVGIPTLTPRYRSEDDHVLHEIDSITPTAPAPCPLTAHELIERFRTASEHNWF